jgi:ketosteroid isomerase-like protein
MEDAMRSERAAASEISLLRDLNEAYIDAVRRSDARWFDAILLDDFCCSLPDGSLIRRQAFLERAARPLDISSLAVHDVEVRLLGDAAIVHARTSFMTAEGRPGAGRYTDVWTRHTGRWQVAAAHFTRHAG